MTFRKPKDRDFIETQEGLLFCVVGYLHPPEKYIAYLKYSPARTGRWQRGGTAYHRELAFYHAHQVALTIDELEERYPHYVQTSPVWDIRFSMVPQKWIRTYYCPELRLSEIMACPKDPLEAATVEVVKAIQSATEIPVGDIGVTGSILLGIHSPEFSDIDLTIYGRENCHRLRQIMTGLELEGASSMEIDYRDEWCRGVVQNHGLTYRQADWLISRRWNFVHFGKGRYVVSLHPTRADGEILEVYGQHTYREVGTADIEATLTDTGDALFLPAIYHIAEVAVLDGPPAAVAEICSYEGLFGGVGESGTRVRARGKLERIDGGPDHRLVVGSSQRQGLEYILPIEVAGG